MNDHGQEENAQNIKIFCICTGLALYITNKDLDTPASGKQSNEKLFLWKTCDYNHTFAQRTNLPAFPKIHAL